MIVHVKHSDMFHGCLPQCMNLDICNVYVCYLNVSIDASLFNLTLKLMILTVSE